jgi:hypothetical protein
MRYLPIYSVVITIVCCGLIFKSTGDSHTIDRQAQAIQSLNLQITSQATSGINYQAEMDKIKKLESGRFKDGIYRK